MESIYLNDWKDAGREGMREDFAISDEELRGIEVLLASYTYEDYEGSAFVLFRKNGKLFEVNGGHCSCYGLEGQWEPEETSVESLKHRLEHDTYYFNGMRDEMRQVLDGL